MANRIHILRIWENGRSYAAISFPYDSELIARVKNIRNSFWDSSKRIWKIPFFESNLSEFIREYGECIDTDSEILLIPLKTEMVRRNYSKKTQRTYILYNKALIRNIGKHPYRIRDYEIREYLDGLYEKGLASVSIRLILQAVKFYYKIIIGKGILKNYPLPKKEKRIPEALNREEVRSILSSLSNPKHRLLLQICYGSGLRVSEVIGLRGTDIDWERKSIRIRQGKGKKDRFSLLPGQCIEDLKGVIDRNGPRSWIFPGMKTGSSLSVRSAENIFHLAKSKAKVTKDVSIHDLRHAFAIHLLENGTSIKLIQSLLGHASVKTTEIYARIVNPSVSKIKSPLDEI